MKKKSYLYTGIFILALSLGFTSCYKAEELYLSEIEALTSGNDLALIQKTVTKPWTAQGYVDGKVSGIWNDTIINDPKTFNQLIGERDGQSSGIISHTLDYLVDYDATLRKWTPQAATFEIETDEINNTLTFRIGG